MFDGFIGVSKFYQKSRYFYYLIQPLNIYIYIYIYNYLLYLHFDMGVTLGI